VIRLLQCDEGPFAQIQIEESEEWLRTYTIYEDNINLKYHILFLRDDDG
jgi:hypothetical protein